MQWMMTATMTVVACFSIAGCASDDTKAELGDAVRHMTEQQIYDRDAAYNPDPAPVLGGDVDRLNNVLESHRNSVQDPAAASDIPEPGVSTRNR